MFILTTHLKLPDLVMVAQLLQGHLLDCLAPPNHLNYLKYKIL